MKTGYGFAKQQRYAFTIKEHAMPTKTVLRQVPLLLAFMVRPAKAFLDAPYIASPSPVAGNLVTVSIYGGGCDLVDTGIVNPPVTQQGNVIRILFSGIHETDPEYCFYGVGTSTFPVGAYPAGAYTLRVDRQYGSFSGVPITETLGTIPFIVAPSVPLPAMDVTGAMALLISIMAIAARAATRAVRQTKRRERSASSD